MVTSAGFGSLAISRGIEFRRDPAEILVATATTTSGLIDLAESVGLVVMGLDGLQADGAVVVPMMDFIADFSGIAGSWEERVRVSASAARDVLAAWEGATDLIEVTLDGLDE
jgi:hypothetical protein